MRTIGLVALLALAGCAAPGKALLELPKNMETGRESTRPRIEEQGTYFIFKLDIEGEKDGEVPVRMFDKDTNVLLGEAVAKPSFETTEWSAFQVFVPKSRLYQLRDKENLALFAVSPSDPSSFLGRVDMTWNRGQGSDYAWSDVTFKDDVSLPEGGEGLELTGTLQLRGYKDVAGKIFLLIRDTSGREVEDASGDRVRIEANGLTIPYDDCVFRAGQLVLHVPYERLKHLPPERELFATPALMLGGTLYDTNVHVRFWAGGSPERRARALEGEMQELDGQIESLEKDLEALRGEKTE